MISRREFLKISSLLPLSTINSTKKSLDQPSKTDADTPNILFVIFDTLSAKHISLYGYDRNTMPNLARFADKATVYHSHYSAGNSTTPGVSSLFTGTYPWTNRGIHTYGMMLPEFSDKNMFSFFGKKQYYRKGFSHNMLVNFLMHQCRSHIEDFILPNDLSLFEG